MIDVVVKDDRTGAKSCVTSRGQIVVSPIDFSTAYNATASVDDTAYVLVEPVHGQRFVVTDILLYANKNVGAGDATVVLYEATDSSTTTEDKVVLQTEMLKNSSRDLTGLNLLISESRWLNIKTDDNTVFATVMGYYTTA